MEILGFKLRPELLTAIIVLAIIIWITSISSCAKVNSIQEGMATLDYKMGEGVHSSWETREQDKGSSIEWRMQDHDAHLSDFVSPDEKLAFFARTQFKPECCGSSYASSGGCACMSKQQMNYLNTRGGNRTVPDSI